MHIFLKEVEMKFKIFFGQYSLLRDFECRCMCSPLFPVISFPRPLSYFHK